MVDRSLAQAVLDGPTSVVDDRWARGSTALAMAVVRAPLPDRPVAVLCAHGPSTVTAMLGILRAGRAYLVLDPRAPDAFRADVVDRHPVGAVVTDAAHVDVAGRLGVPVIVVEELRRDADPGAVVLPWPEPTAPASVSFTSGSSGRPKAVVHAQRSLLHNALAYGEAIGISRDDVVLVTGPFSAAAAGTPTWTALVHGARLVSLDLAAKGAAALHDVLTHDRVTVAHIPPAALGALGAGEVAHPGVRLVSLGGDRLTADQVRVARRVFPHATLLHRYSTSETHWIAGRRFEPGDPVPDGPVALPDVVPWLRVRVESTPGREAAPGESGEVVVAGEWLALGYLDDPQRTAERFTYTAEGRVYRTGDLARWEDDGSLLLLGRADDVVKVSGTLVDPAIVEEALLRIPGVSGAAVVAVDTDRGTPGLVAYVVGDDLRGWQVRARLADALPRTHVPGRVEVVTSLPVTDRGKVDRAVLRERAAHEGRAGYVPPSAGIEMTIATAIADVLAVTDVGRDDDLLALGADSLAVTEIAARLEASLGRPIDDALLVRHPTPALLASRLSGSDDEPNGRLIRVLDGPADAVPVALFSGGGGGHVTGMADLARAVGGRTAWVVVPKGFDERARPDRTIAAMGRTAAAALVGVVGDGPVVVVGHSIGGTVALQTARELTAHGVAVPLVVLLDTLAVTPDVNAGRHLSADLPQAIAYATQVRASRGQGTSLPRKAYWAARLPVRRMRRRWLAATAGVIPRTGRRQHEAFEAVAKVASRHFTEAPYHGEVLLVRAVGGLDPRGHSADLGWGQVPGVRLTVVEVTGTHEGFIAGSAGLTVAAQVRTTIDTMLLDRPADR